MNDHTSSIKAYRRHPESFKVVKWDGTLEHIMEINKVFTNLNHCISITDGEIYWEIHTEKLERDEMARVTSEGYILEQIAFEGYSTYHLVKERQLEGFEEVTDD